MTPPAPAAPALPGIPDRWLAVLSIAVAAALVAYTMRIPPVLSEAFEYVELARNLVETGELREDHYRDWFPSSRALPLPHPAGQRANAYVLLMAPLVALLGVSTAVVVIPGILGHLFFAYAARRAGRSLFGEDVGSWMGLLTLLHPRLLYQAGFDPHPAEIAAAATVLGLAAFVARQHLRAAAWIAVGCLFHMSVMLVVPTFPLWILARDRRELLRPRLWAGAALALVLLSPLLVRNALVFGDPLAMESRDEASTFTVEQRSSWTRLEQLYRYHRPRLDQRQASRESALARLANLRYVFLGDDAIDFYPGVLELAGLALLPFAAFGAWRTRRRRATQLVATTSAVLVIAYGAAAQGYEDRYFFLLVPLAAGLGCVGLVAVTEARPGTRGRLPSAVLAFVVLAEVVPALLPLLQEAVGDDDAPRRLAGEFRQASRWVVSSTPADGRVLAFPSFSVASFTRRLAVPFPAGDLGEVEDVVREHAVDSFLYVRLFGDQTLPRLAILDPVASGEFVTVGRIATSTDAAQYAPARFAEDHDERLLAAFARVRPLTPFARRPLWGYWTALAPRPALAIAGHALLGVAFVAVWSRGRRAERAALVVVLVGLAFGSRVAAVLSVPAAHGIERMHPFSEDSLRAVLAQAPPGAALAWVPPDDAAQAEAYRLDLQVVLGRGVEPAARSAIEERPAEILIVALPEPRAGIADAAGFAASMQHMAALEPAARDLNRRAAAAGRPATWIGGAFVILPASGVDPSAR